MTDEDKKWAHARKNMQDKELTQVLDTEKFQAFTLTKKDYEGRMGSTMIIFSPEGIIVTGDLCPGYTTGHGVVSVLGYGLGWFAGRLNPGYLAEKFLRTGFHAELAVEELKEWHTKGGRPYDDEDSLTEEKLEKLQSLIDSLECGDYEGERYYDAMMDIYDEPDLLVDGAPGYGYDPTDLMWLSVIQERFAELYQEQLASKEKKDGQ